MKIKDSRTKRKNWASYTRHKENKLKRIKLEVKRGGANQKNQIFT